jgi:hypothetical protein
LKKKIFQTAIILVLLTSSMSLSKRAFFDYPDSVISEGIKYEATYKDGFCFYKAYIEAIDLTTKKVIWKKKIYQILMNPIMEHDVQWVEIKKVELKNGHLIIENEKGKIYQLNLKNQKLKKLKT